MVWAYVGWKSFDVRSSQGKLVALSPFDGRLLGELSLNGGVVAAPAVAQGTMVFLTKRANLSAYR